MTGVFKRIFCLCRMCPCACSIKPSFLSRSRSFFSSSFGSCCKAERRNINDIYALDMTESLEKYFSKIEDSYVLIIEREHIRVRSPIQNNGGKTNKTSITRGLKEY